VSTSESEYHLYQVEYDSKSSDPQERFTGYLNSVRILRLDSEDLEAHDYFSAKKFAIRNRAQMLNLTEIRPDEPCANYSTLERTFDFDGQQVVVEHFIDSPRLTPLKASDLLGPSHIQTEGILTGIRIRQHDNFEYIEDALQVEEAQLLSVLSLIDWRPPPGVGISPAHPFAYLLSLELSVKSATKPLFEIKLDELDRLLSACPQLSRLGCRITAPEATEPTLNRIFSKAKHLASVYLQTDGYLVPHLSALSRFEEVTLACTMLLTNTDHELLHGHVKRDQPFVPRLRHFTYEVTTGLYDTVRAEDTPCNKPYSVARLIRKLLPRDCVFATSTAHYHSVYGMKEPMKQWWNEFTGIMDIMMKEIDPPRPAILPLPREP
jgi:hypothetical protein